MQTSLSLIPVLGLAISSSASAGVIAGGYFDNQEQRVKAVWNGLHELALVPNPAPALSYSKTDATPWEYEVRVTESWTNNLVPVRRLRVEVVEAHSAHLDGPHDGHAHDDTPANSPAGLFIEFTNGMLYNHDDDGDGTNDHFLFDKRVTAIHPFVGLGDHYDDWDLQVLARTNAATSKLHYTVMLLGRHRGSALASPLPRPVPSPASAALLGAGALLSTRRRR